MKIQSIFKIAIILLLLFGAKAFAGDLVCYGKTSTTSHFVCTSIGNCTWWAAYKRPDLAAKITGSGWNGGQWYDKFNALGFSVGLQPRNGAIVEFTGHVAYVEKTYSDGSFDVSEMDSTGGLGVGGIYYATYKPAGNGKYTRNNGTVGGWTLKGFIYNENRSYNLDIHRDGNVGWYPLGLCQDAEIWYRLTDEGNKTIAVLADKRICDSVALMCYVP